MAKARDLIVSFLQGGPPENGLPERVRREIHQREIASERLIGWVQLASVLFFSSLYAIAPRAEGGSGFNFVPLALGSYFLFTVLRLVLSYRFELPKWYLFLSILVDMALLVGLIFSFHIQYGQHPTFYLKTPTLMYVFIFIALRALRFDPRFVLASGFVAVTGWRGLVAYAVLADMDRMRVTRNYVEYLTGNTILIGAELDKTMVILTVTIVLGAALFRGRLMLFDAIRQQAAVADLRRFFAPEVADSITEAPTVLKPGQGKTREATILYLDIRSFTSTAGGLPPETVMAVLGVYQELALAIIREEAGRVDKFLGDGILATFGALRSSESHAADALRAMERVVETVQLHQRDFARAGWPGPLAVGGAAAAGTVTVGTVGAADRLEFTVIGDAVNRAAKLEDMNKLEKSRAMTDRATFDLAAQQGYRATNAEVREGKSVPGISHPIDLVILARLEGTDA